MITLAIGKKGSGKSALLRKLGWRVLQARGAVRPLVLWHDPQAQIRGRVFVSIDEWRRQKQVPLLSVFRGVEVEDLARLAVAVKDVTLVLDELDLVSSDKKWRADTVRKIVHYGRHLRVSLLGGFRRTANVPEDILSQSDHVFLFAHEPDAARDLKAVEERWGPTLAAAVAKLEPMQFYVAK